MDEMANEMEREMASELTNECENARGLVGDPEPEPGKVSEPEIPLASAQTDGPGSPDPDEPPGQ